MRAWNSTRYFQVLVVDKRIRFPVKQIPSILWIRSEYEYRDLYIRYNSNLFGINRE